MDISLIYGLIVGVALTVTALIGTRKWRAGRGVRKGRKGEKTVSRELRKLKRKETLILNDLILNAGRDRTSQIDHLVISTRGIFVIETKSLAGRISGGEHSQYWQQHLRSQSRRIYSPVLQNAAHLRVLRFILPSLPEVAFTSVVVFTEAWRIEIRADDILEPRFLLPDRRISRTLIPSERRKRRWWCPGREVRLDERNIVTPLEDLIPEIERRERIISRDDIDEIGSAVIEAVRSGRDIRRAHTEYARNVSREKEDAIRRGICPLCGEKLVIRKGGEEEFVGCLNYPYCRFTCSIDLLH